MTRPGRLARALALAVILGTLTPAAATAAATGAATGAASGAASGAADAPRLRDVAGLTAWHGRLLFLASDATHGRAVWTSDGTAAGTRLVRVVDPGMTKLHGVDEQFGHTSRAYFFVTDDGVHGDELWRSDGTRAGTRLVRDLTPGAADSTIRDLAGVGRTLFFAHSSKARPTPRLWTSNGTRNGTVAVPHRRWPAPTSPTGMYPWHGSAYFAGTARSAGGTTLWRSDGTAGGTRPVRDLRPQDRGLKQLTGFAGGATRLYFVAGYGTGSPYDEGVWRTDGTAGGTRLVRDVDGQRGTDHTHTTDLTTQGDRLLFVDDDCTHGTEPWGSDGTSAGTVLIDLDPAGTTCRSSSYPQALTALGGDFLLAANDPADDGSHLALYRSDGTPSGTTPIADLAATGSPAESVVGSARAADRFFLFAWSSATGASTHALYVTDGTAAGTQVVRDFDTQGPASFAPVAMTGAGDDAFFVGSTDTPHHQVLWVSDGTPTGTSALTG